MRFEEIPGLPEVKKSLLKSVKEEKVAHAQIFAGIEGGANLALARAYISYLYCEKRTDSDSCGECPSCQKNRKLVHPDVHFVYPILNTKDGKKIDPISKAYIKEWRSFLPPNPYPVYEDWVSFFGGENKKAIIYREESREIIKDLTLVSFEGNFKTMLIWLPELMHISAANGILKILEEPPPKTLFILVSNQASQVISTILSRCISINVRPFFDKEIAQFLVDIGMGAEKAGQISHLADGSLNMAFKLEENLEDDNHTRLIIWMRACFEFNVMEMVNGSDTFSKRSKISQKSLFEYGLNMLRESLVIGFSSSIQLAIESEKAFIRDFSKIIDWELIEEMSKELESAIVYLERNANARIVYLDLSLRFASLFKQIKTVKS